MDGLVTSQSLPSSPVPIFTTVQVSAPSMGAFSCRFAYGAQHAELWFTFGANSILATLFTKHGWFAYCTTYCPRSVFAYGAQSAEL